MKNQVFNFLYLIINSLHKFFSNLFVSEVHAQEIDNSPVVTGGIIAPVTPWWETALGFLKHNWLILLTPILFLALLVFLIVFLVKGKKK